MIKTMLFIVGVWLIVYGLLERFQKSIVYTAILSTAIILFIVLLFSL